MDKDERHLVVLVHGTFAHAASTEGPDWWQRTSSVWQYLERALPEGVALPEDEEVFRWKSVNSERARRRASRELLDFMHTLERQRRPYHLIGHSHGGSVIWGALVEAARSKRPLAYLRTWTTVGTPFFHFDSNLVLAKRMVTSSIVLVLAGMGLLIHIVNAVLTTNLLSWLTGIPIIMLYTLVLIGALVALWVPLIESVTTREEQKFAEDAFNTHGKKWLGIWSPHDEAINSLARTVRLKMNIVPMRSFDDQAIFASDRLFLETPARVFLRLSAALWNHAQPRADRIVNDQLRGYLQGNDRPSTTVYRVSVSPSASLKDSAILPLPDEVSARLLQAANEAAQKAIPQLRAVLGLSAFSTDLGLSTTNLTGRELVHTSYFYDPGVLDLLALHICWGCGSGHDLAAGEQRSKWLEAWKDSLADALSNSQERKHSVK